MTDLKNKKLATNFNDKKNYIVHIANLQFYLKKDLILIKIHKVIEFTHFDWLSAYVNLNTILRQKTNNDFEKVFYKLMFNAAYGNMLENICDRVNVEFWINAKQFDKWISSPFFANNINIIKEDCLCLVKTSKRTIYVCFINQYT